MTYKDMTFCLSDCQDRDCIRRYDLDVAQKAKLWWGGDNPPVALTDFSRHCSDYKPIVDDVEQNSNEYIYEK